MPRRLPPLNALRAFETAARLESFTAAARELHVTHGAISRQVRGLEEWLDLALFERSNRKVTLTEQGRSYFAEIGAALDRIAAATERQRQRGPARLLRVHALDTFSMRWLIPRLARFASQHPLIELKLTTSPDPIPALREPFDVIIRGGPDDVDDYVSRPFLSEGRIPVCSPALAKRTPICRPADLANHTLLIPATYARIWPDWLAAAGVPDLVPRRTLTLEHFYLTLQAALEGLGVAMGPLRLVREDVAARRLVIPLSRPVLPARSYFLYVAKHRSDDRAIRAFCDWLIEAGREDSGLEVVVTEDQY